jgi:hypothetical protein
MKKNSKKEQRNVSTIKLPPERPVVTMSSTEPEPSKNALQMNHDRSKANPYHKDSALQKQMRENAAETSETGKQPRRTSLIQTGRGSGHGENRGGGRGGGGERGRGGRIVDRGHGGSREGLWTEA